MAAMTVGGMFAAQVSKPVQLRLDGGQLIAQRKRKERFCRAMRSIVRARLAPAAQQTILVARLGAEIVQTLAEVGDAHRGVRSGDQDGFEIIAKKQAEF